MKLIEFCDYDGIQPYIEKIDMTGWSAARLLANYLRTRTLESYLLEGWRIFMLVDDDNDGRIVSFVTYSRRDCVVDDALFPWIGFVFTAPEYRGNHYSGRLIEHCCDIAHNEGMKDVYIGTPHTGLYEKYGFEYLFDRTEQDGNKCRVYHKNIY